MSYAAMQRVLVFLALLLTTVFPRPALAVAPAAPSAFHYNRCQAGVTLYWQWTNTTGISRASVWVYIDGVKQGLSPVQDTTTGEYHSSFIWNRANSGAMYVVVTNSETAEVSPPTATLQVPAAPASGCVSGG
jgi:hypothetical protein